MPESPIQMVSRESLNLAAALLRAGKLCAFPTETVYGLGADARSEDAVRRIYEKKGRPASNPLIVHISPNEAARVLCRGSDLIDGARVSEVALVRLQVLAERYWPGPLTLVLPRGPAIPPLVSAGLDTVALRVPGHPVALELLSLAALPIAAPSANPSTGISPTRAEHVAAGLAGLELILDGGPCLHGIESTVLDLTKETPRLLRPGAVPLVELRQVLGEVETLPMFPTGLPAPSPGLMERHYAPRAQLWVLSDLELTQIDARLLPQPVAYLVRTPSLLPMGVLGEVLPNEASGYAADLYAALHRMDDAGAQTILLQAPPVAKDQICDDLWHAISDRLRRASARPSAI